MNHPEPSVPLARTRRLLWPVLAILVAFFVRVYRLPEIPFGWHPDEATKALMARDVLAGKYLPVFFSAFTGREALYVYLEAGAFALLGEGIFAARLLSAFVGTLTVAATYRLTRVWFDRWVAGLSAVLMAVSLWHLIASRNGYRAVIQPLIQLPVLWCLVQGWRREGRQRWRAFIVAGLFLGLSQYTYTAARMFPMLVVGMVGAAILIAPRLVTRRWRALGVMVLVAFLVFVPLGLYFYHHPQDFYGRAAQISVFTPAWAGGDPWGRLWQSVRETARMFTAWGDPNYRFNLAGRPVFGWIDGALFYVGVLLCLWRAVRARGLRRVIYVSLLLWMGLMLLPMTLSAEGLPYYQRAIGVLPGVYVFPALVLAAAIEWVGRAWGRTWLIYSGTLILLLALLGGRTYGEYFEQWHLSERNDDDRRAAMVYVARWIEEAEIGGEFYLSSEYAEHPTLAFLTPGRYDGIHWFDARYSLPLPPAGQPATYVMLRENPPQEALLDRAPALRRTETVLDRFGRPVFDVYRWDGGYPAPADQSPAIWSWEVTFEPGDPQGLRHPIDLPANFGDVMAFQGHDRHGEPVAPGETLEVILHWRLLDRPDRNYSIFVHLLDRESQIVGEYDENAYATRFWQAGGGEWLMSYFPVRVKPGTPPGEYQLEFGVYNQASGERLPIYDEAGAMVGDRLLLEPVIVE